MTSWPLTVDLLSGLNARHGAPCHSGQCAMCCEVTEGFVSIVEAGEGMCWSADKSYVGHPCTLS